MLPVLLLTACTAATQSRPETVIAIYNEDDPAQDPAMVSFTQDPVEMNIPLGWRQETIDNRGELKFRFVKHDGSRLLIFCFGEDRSQSDIRNILQKSIMSAMPDARKTAGPFELDVPGLRPVFELYQGSIEAEGVDIAMDADIAWRMEDRLGGCRYGVFYASATNQDNRNLYEFLAIARSLK
ncbi:MAG: hypothetical protein EP315_09190 [Gammaproteobacteria bacterium]|nr:MAG: hypothetical protein EP315_09190 [Gammaproteobacteria bacterium]